MPQKLPRMAEATLKDVADLREYVTIYANEQAEIKASTMYSDDYKAGMARNRQQYWVASAQKAATYAWKSAASRVAKAEADLRRVSSRKDSSTDFLRINTLTAEFSRELTRPVGAMSKDNVGSRLRRLEQQARDRGDVEALRALRVSAAPYVDSQPDLADVKRLFDEDEAREYADVADAELELRAAREGVDVIRSAILSVEKDLTGWNPDALFAPLSPWQKAVLGEDAASLGYIGEKGSAAFVSE